MGFVRLQRRCERLVGDVDQIASCMIRRCGHELKYGLAMTNEIILLIGYNASGKSSLVESYVDKGAFRINRDLLGGSLNDLALHVSKAVSDGHKTIILDNTYPTIKSRANIVDLAKKNNIPIRCLWLQTSFEDAQFNACARMVKKHGRLLTPEEMKKSKDPNDFPPVALFTYRKNFEKPTVEEGFETVKKIDFVRQWTDEHVNKALFLDYDGTLRISVGKENWPEKPSDVEILPRRKEILQKYVDQGYRLLGVSNQSAIAKGLSVENVIECFERTNELLGYKIEYLFCPHKIPPVQCFCRKPGVGLTVEFIFKYNLDPRQCIFVGDMKTDETCAKRSGMKFIHESEFFK